MTTVIKVNNGNSETIVPAVTAESKFFWSKYFTSSIQHEIKNEVHFNLGVDMMGNLLQSKAIKQKKK